MRSFGVGDFCFLRIPHLLVIGVRGFSGVIPEQSGGWILRRVVLLCLFFIVGANFSDGQDAATKVGANGRLEIAGRTDLRIGHYIS